MKIFYAKADNFGCGWYRCELPAKYMNKRGHQAVVKTGININEDVDLKEAELIIIQRQTSPHILEFVKLAKARGQKVAYELDDPLWKIPKNSPVAKDWTPELIEGAINIMKECDCIITATEMLATDLLRFNPKVYLIPNFIEMPESEIVKHDKIHIGWSGSASHKAVNFIEPFVSVIERIKEDYKDKVEILFFGSMPDELSGLVTYVQGIKPEQYMNFLQDLSFDIGLIPSADHPQNYYRSNLKFLEYSICGTMTIASPINSYTQIPEDAIKLVHKNRFRNWLKIIVDAIENPEMRQATVDKAKIYSGGYLMGLFGIAHIENIYEKILGGK